MSVDELSPTSTKGRFLSKSRGWFVVWAKGKRVQGGNGENWQQTLSMKCNMYVFLLVCICVNGCCV